jgi:hypothetical protein
MTDRAFPFLSALDARAIIFAEGLLPRLPGLVLEDPRPLMAQIQRFAELARSGSKVEETDFKHSIGKLLAPWPALRRRWEEAFPEDKVKGYELQRDDGIRYAARLALDSADSRLGDDAAEFYLTLREALLETQVREGGGEWLRELMRRHTTTRSLLETTFPAARYPRQFHGWKGSHVM